MNHVNLPGCNPFLERNVQQIVATGGAFAACLAENGQVVTWGDGDFGGATLLVTLVGWDKL